MTATPTPALRTAATAWPFLLLSYALLLAVFLPSSMWPWPGYMQQHVSGAPPHQQQQHHESTRAAAAGPDDIDGAIDGAARAYAAVAALVMPHGYVLQEAFVTTDDGFILRLHRVLAPESVLDARSPNATMPRRPVFLQHALMDSSAGWLLLGPRRALALQLADAGFDVWLGNSRGNRFSRNHTRLQPHDPAFWAFSWEQQAAHDLPASIGHVLSVTQQRSVVLIGYSQVRPGFCCVHASMA
jgi:hypothetical protein